MSPVDGPVDEATVRLRPVAPAPAEVPPGLRLTCALMVPLVLYSYLVGLWLSKAGENPDFLIAVREWVNRPTGVGEDFGAFAACVLLLGFGYVTAASPRPWRAAAGLLLPGVVAASGLLYEQTELLWVFTSATLGAALVVGGGLVVKGRSLPPLGAVPVQLGVVVALTLLLGSQSWIVLDRVAFAVLPVVGQTMFLVRSKAVGAVWGGSLVAAGWGLFALAEPMHPAWEGFWYPVTVCVAILVVQVALPVGEVLGRTLPVRWLANRAGWVLALTGPVGLTVQDAVADWPWGLVLPLGIAATLAGAELGRRLQVLGRVG